jgi:hypothetical protein
MGGTSVVSEGGSGAVCGDRVLDDEVRCEPELGVGYGKW